MYLTSYTSECDALPSNPPPSFLRQLNRLCKTRSHPEWRQRVYVHQASQDAAQVTVERGLWVYDGDENQLTPCQVLCAKDRKECTIDAASKCPANNPFVMMSNSACFDAIH